MKYSYDGRVYYISNNEDLKEKAFEIVEKFGGDIHESIKYCDDMPRDSLIKFQESQRYYLDSVGHFMVQIFVAMLVILIAISFYQYVSKSIVLVVLYYTPLIFLIAIFLLMAFKTSLPQIISYKKMSGNCKNLWHYYLDLCFYIITHYDMAEITNHENYNPFNEEK